MLSSEPLNLDDFNRIVFFTGAGLSAESGIPTYRGAGGIWDQYDYREYACEAAFEADPEKVWEFHLKRRSFVRGCAPNQGHQLIADLAGSRPGVTVITQNIDGLHQRAGSAQVIELHGGLFRSRCPRDGKTIAAEVHDQLRCDCGTWLRPDIVWFGDSLDRAVIMAAMDAVESCDLLIAVGTSAMVYPAAGLPISARERGAYLVEINLEDTPLSGLYHRQLRGSASAMLAELLTAG